MVEMVTVTVAAEVPLMLTLECTEHEPPGRLFAAQVSAMGPVKP